MAQKAFEDILFPVGRFVQGDLDSPNTTNADGQPLVIKNGANAGQPRVEYYIAVAIPKTPGATHWAQETSQHPKIGAWGAKIWNFGHAQWPAGQAQRPDFAWKIEDGDSAIPNKAGKKNCEREGFPGCWIVKLSGGTRPKVCNADGSQVIDAVGAVKPGYYVQAVARVTSNESTQTAGLYLNHAAIALAGYGEEIRTGIDTGSVGFGGVALPAGASTVPVAAMGIPAVPGASTAVPALPGAAAVPGPAVPVPGAAIVPNPGFVAGAVAVPGVGAAIPVPGAAAAIPLPGAAAVHVPVLTMTAKAGGQTADAFRAASPLWTDAKLIEEGYAVMQ